MAAQNESLIGAGKGNRTLDLMQKKVPEVATGLGILAEDPDQTHKLKREKARADVRATESASSVGTGNE